MLESLFLSYLLGSLWAAALLGTVVRAKTGRSLAAVIPVTAVIFAWPWTIAYFLGDALGRVSIWLQEKLWPTTTP